MVQPFQVPFNIPKGTAVADGYRIAPPFNTLGQTGVDINGLILSGSSYNNVGPGMPMTPLATWNFTPYPTTAGNVANPVPAVVVGPSWLTLAGDNAATTLTASGVSEIFPTGAPNTHYLQFDWPRVPCITIGGGVLPGAVNVTFFGIDYYGFPLQHTVTIPGADYSVNMGTFPGPVFQNPTLGPPTPLTPAGRVPQKAFYRLTGVYFNGTSGTAEIQCQVSNTFGLPFVAKSYLDMTAIGWGSNGQTFNMLVQSGEATLAAGTVNVRSPAALGIFFGAAGFDATTPLTLAHFNAATVAANTGVLYPENAVLSSPTQGIGQFSITSTNGADDSKVSWSLINGGAAIFSPADLRPPTSIDTTVYPIQGAATGDVRGLIELPYIGETWAPPPDGQSQCIVSWYCEGFDEQLNILNAGAQPQFNGVPNPPSANNIVPPNIYTQKIVVNTVPTPFTINTLYGVQQYYTGVPA